MTNDLLLRDVTDADLAIFFEQQLDPDAIFMAAFTAKDPKNRDAFIAHSRKNLANTANINKTIVCNGEVVGSIASYVDAGRPEVTYWIGKAHWGKGIATRALAAFLAHENQVRPMYARIAEDNSGSRRVLEKCGFKVVGASSDFANARGEVINELLLELATPSD